tara:strand:+ start:530 stop:760 length:231 start_codon:yes stop_codon:yes gene_type:complete
MLNRSKHQVRINLRPDVLEKATRVAQAIGRSLSEVIEDSILRTTESQMHNLGVKQRQIRTATEKATNNEKSEPSSS